MTLIVCRLQQSDHSHKQPSPTDHQSELLRLKFSVVFSVMENLISSYYVLRHHVR